MSRCDLYLDNYVDHYTGGQTIVGHVEVTFTSEKEVHGISVFLKGEAKTQWTETESYYDSHTKRSTTRSVTYSGRHPFVADEIQLIGGRTTIAAGIYKYPFHYVLPANLPSTFKESIGKIEYKIKAVVKRPMLNFNYEAESEFVVVTPVNLNADPCLRNPETRTKTKTTYFCCWSKGDINVQISIPRRGIAIGEELPLSISVQNLSQSNVEQIKCKVKKKIKYTTTTPSYKTRISNDTIFSDHYSGVGAHGENTYAKVILLNTTSLIPNFIQCNIIEVSYELEVTFVLSGMHKNIQVDIPVTVGHIAIGAVPPPVAAMTAQSLPHAIPNAATIDAVPPYGFINPIAGYNPGLPMPSMPAMSTMPVPPPYNPNFGGDTGYPPAIPSAPSAYVSARGVEPSTYSKDSKEEKCDWEFVEDPRNKDLPSYDEAMKYPTKY